MRRNWRRYRLGFRDRDDELRWAEKALAQLRAFVSTQDVNVQPIMMEELVEAEVSAGLVLRDRVDKEPDGSLHVIDYKTGGVVVWSRYRRQGWTKLDLCSKGLAFPPRHSQE